MDSQIVNVTDAIDRAPVSGKQVLTFVLCALVALMDGYDIGSIGSMAPLIANSLHLDVHGFGPIFSGSFVGMMIGALLIGPAADRLGRKTMIIASTIVFGGFTLLISTANSFSALLVFRFLAGVGLGGALPNVIALTSEYSPRRKRSFIITAMSCGLPAGGVSAPLLGSYLVQHSSWQATFLIGGTLPLILAAVLAFGLPESVRFLVVTSADPQRIALLLHRMVPAMRDRLDGRTAPRFVLNEASGRGEAALVNLFAHGRTAMTLLLWVAFFMTLLTALFIVSWLPTVLRQSGLPLSLGLVIASMFSLGGVLGTAVLGYLMDRFGAFPVLTTAYVAIALLVGAFGFFGGSVTLLGSATFVAGFFVFGSQGGLQALSASLYPTAIRSAGIGWAFGFGRIGSIVGPAIGGLMLSSGWPLTRIFLAAAVPAVVALVSIVLLRRCTPVSVLAPAAEAA